MERVILRNRKKTSTEMREKTAGDTEREGWRKERRQTVEVKVAKQGGVRQERKSQR